MKSPGCVTKSKMRQLRVGSLFCSICFGVTLLLPPWISPFGMGSHHSDAT